MKIKEIKEQLDSIISASNIDVPKVEEGMVVRLPKKEYNLLLQDLEDINVYYQGVKIEPVGDLKDIL